MYKECTATIKMTSIPTCKKTFQWAPKLCFRSKEHGGSNHGNGDDPKRDAHTIIRLEEAKEIDN